MALGLVCAVATGCGKPEKKPPVGEAVKTAKLSEGDVKVVAKVGKTTITLAEFERRLSEQSAFSRARYGSNERKREFLDTLVRFELLAAEAEAKGHGEHPDVVMVRKQAMVRQLMAQEIRGLVKMSDITPADIKGYYDDHLPEFHKPAQVRAAHIVLADEAEAQALLAEIKTAIAAKSLKAREVFGDFAKARSTDLITKASGGDLRFFSLPGEVSKRADDAPKVPDAVAIAAHALAKVGQLVEAPIKTGAGWHLVQKTGFRRPFKRKLSDVSTQIRNKLFRARKGKAMEQYVTDLRNKAKITIDDAVLDTAKAPASAGGGIPRLQQPGQPMAPPFKMPSGAGMRPQLPGQPGRRPSLPIPRPRGRK